MEALRRVQANTIEKRLLNARGNPSFGMNFYWSTRRVSTPASRCTRAKYAVCTENGPQTLDTEPLLPGKAGE